MADGGLFFRLLGDAGYDVSAYVGPRKMMVTNEA